MRYWGPINSTGGIYGNDGYVDGNPAIGVQGSIPTFRTFEQIMRELQNLVNASGFTPDDVMNGLQVTQSVQRGKIVYALDIGTANALAVTLNPAPPAYGAGFLVHLIKGVSANSITTPTLNVNGLGPVTVVAMDGSPIASGGLPSNTYMAFMHDGTYFRLVSEPFTGRTKPFYGFNAMPGTNSVPSSDVATLCTNYASYTNTLMNTTWNGNTLTIGEEGFYLITSWINTNLPPPGSGGTAATWSYAHSVGLDTIAPPSGIWSYGGIVAQLSAGAYKGGFDGFSFVRYLYAGETAGVYAGHNAGVSVNFPVGFNALFMGK